MNEQTIPTEEEALAGAAGEKEQELADPVETEGEKGQELADPAGNEKPDDPAEGGKNEMDETERHLQARLRQRREDEARRQAEQARIDQIYADMFQGQVSPYTNKPILTEQDYREHTRLAQTGRQNAALREAGIEPDVIRAIVDDRVAQHPDVLRARAAAEEAERMEQQMVRESAEREIREQMQAVHALDENVKTLEDITKMPTAAVFRSYIDKGLSISDAFYLANRQSIETKRAAAAKQAAMNALNGKGHLESRSGAGEGAVTVPEDVKAQYRRIDPSMTSEQMQKAYESFRKSIIDD